jgi:hypothetical protein
MIKKYGSMKKSGKTEVKWEDLPRKIREITSFFHLVIDDMLMLTCPAVSPTGFRVTKT